MCLGFCVVARAIGGVQRTTQQPPQSHTLTMLCCCARVNLHNCLAEHRYTTLQQNRYTTHTHTSHLLCVWYCNLRLSLQCWFYQWTVSPLFGSCFGHAAQMRYCAVCKLLLNHSRCVSVFGLRACELNARHLKYVYIIYVYTYLSVCPYFGVYLLLCVINTINTTHESIFK